MLSVPTLWTVFVINFLALGLIWAYVMRCYPSFEAARFWTGSAFVTAAGAGAAELPIPVEDEVWRNYSGDVERRRLLVGAGV